MNCVSRGLHQNQNDNFRQVSATSEDTLALKAVPGLVRDPIYCTLRQLQIGKRRTERERRERETFRGTFCRPPRDALLSNLSRGFIPIQKTEER